MIVFIVIVVFRGGMFILRIFVLVFVFAQISSLSAASFLVLIIVLVSIFVLTVNYMQTKRPTSLPEKLQTWDFLPKWMTSLAPIDRAICGPLDRIICGPCAKACGKDKAATGAKEFEGINDKRAAA